MRRLCIVACCLVLVGCCLLLYVACCFVYGVNCLVLAVCRVLCVVCGVLFGVCVVDVRCSLRVARRALSFVCCMLLSVDCRIFVRRVLLLYGVCCVLLVG